MIHIPNMHGHIIAQNCSRIPAYCHSSLKASKLNPEQSKVIITLPRKYHKVNVAIRNKIRYIIVLAFKN